jgi:SacI restriction endonuclease
VAKGGGTTRPNRAEAKRILAELWEITINDEKSHAPANIVRMVNANEVGMRFCLPTQLLGKLTDNTLDALVLQTRAGPPGNWNPRTFATSVIVPWNRANQSVLGGSGDPYVSNPLRRPRLDFEPDQLADAGQWATICEILREVQDRSDEAHTRAVLLQVLSAVRDRLRELNFVYVVPDRVSLRQAETLIVRFLAEGSGGDRGLAVAAALFETIRERFGIYAEVRRGVVNAADSATESAGDLECVGRDGNVILAVEVKERLIGDDDLHIAIAKVRELEVRELLFCAKGVMTTQKNQVELTMQRAWASGTNIYHATTCDLIRSLLPLTGEEGIKSFVAHIGHQLDTFNTQPRHRKTWKSLLDEL